MDSYKYLGLVLNEYLDYSVTAKYVAKSATRALGLLIWKLKQSGGLPFDVFKKLYDTTVWSVISYGTAVWGVKEYSVINTVQNKACRFFPRGGQIHTQHRCKRGYGMDTDAYKTDDFGSVTLVPLKSHGQR